jgi:hypothetical protein
VRGYRRAGAGAIVRAIEELAERAWGDRAGLSTSGRAAIVRASTRGPANAVPWVSPRDKLHGRVDRASVGRGDGTGDHRDTAVNRRVEDPRVRIRAAARVVVLPGARAWSSCGARAWSSCVELVRGARAWSSCVELVRGARAWSSCVELVRRARAWSSCVELVRGARVWSSCVELVRGARAWSSCVELVRGTASSARALALALDDLERRGLSEVDEILRDGIRLAQLR